MKNHLYLFVLLIGSNLFGQTDSIERVTIYNKLMSKEIKESEFSKIWTEWNQKISKDYPNLPLDQNEQVHYVFLNEFKNNDKEYLFNRTLEWLSINYGLIPADIYYNLKDGKIIFRNSLNLITNTSCVYTAIISVRDEKIKMEFLSISYQTYYEADYSSGIPDRTVSLNINEVYPIILKKSSEWNSNLLLLKNTDKLFSTEIKNLCDYILFFDKANSF
jgi:hypothetical protein